MANQYHNRISGLDAIHELMWMQSADPSVTSTNDVQAKQHWVDETTGTDLSDGWIWKVRNAGNSAWTTLLDLKTKLLNYVLKSTLTTKGDLYVATASATVTRQGVGSNDTVLVADSAQTNGLKWSTITGSSIASSIALAGSPTTTTQSYGDNSTKIATMAALQAGLATVVDDGNSGTADTIDFSAGNVHKSTLTGNVTYTFTAPPNGSIVVLKVIQGSGPYAITWPAAVHWPSGTAPTLTATNGKVDNFVFLYLDSTYYAVISGQNYTA